MQAIHGTAGRCLIWTDIVNDRWSTHGSLLWVLHFVSDRIFLFWLHDSFTQLSFLVSTHNDAFGCIVRECPYLQHLWVNCTTILHSIDNVRVV